MANGTFGMDHRAIVWCHGLLEKVRQVLHLMIVTENVVTHEQLQSLFHKSDNYNITVATQYETFRVSFVFHSLCYIIYIHLATHSPC
jgi:hypothetical protein